MLPATKEDQPWERLLDTADPQGEPLPWTGGQQYELQGRSMVVLRIRAPQEMTSPLLATAAAAERHEYYGLRPARRGKWTVIL